MTFTHNVLSTSLQPLSVCMLLLLLLLFESNFNDFRLMSKKLVRSRRVQERELRGGWRHGELRAAGVVAVSDGAARLRAASDVSSEKSL